MRPGGVTNLRFLGLIFLAGLSSHSFAQDIQTPKNVRASLAFERAVKAEALAAEHPQDKNLCVKFEESSPGATAAVVTMPIGPFGVTGPKIVRQTTVQSA